MVKREQWGTRFGFIMAAVGSAIGLGNIWRFPYQAYDNGGGAFLIPYFFAMLTAGIPILILEFGLGHKMKGGAPSVFARITKKYPNMEKWEWLGWWQILVAFVISTYYVVILAWTISYVFISVTQGYAADPKAYFYDSFLHITKGPLELGGFQVHVLAALACAWLITWFVLFTGVKKGIELANKLFMPTHIVLGLLLTAKTLTMEGASEGLNWLFNPDFTRIMDYKVWSAAYGQIFYSMSVGFGIMITYASYLPKKTDIVNNGFMTGLLNCGFSMIAGIMVFSILGHMAHAEATTVDKVVSSGVGLAFITIPKAISYLPAPQLFGIVFFLSLTIAGLSSEISITETITAACMDKFGASRKKVATILCVFGFFVSFVYVTGAGLYILDIVDNFINAFGILFGALIEVLLLSWVFRLDVVKNHINPLSDFRVGYWWHICIKYLTPVVLGSMAVANFVGNIQKTYGGYPLKAIIFCGWLVMLAVIFCAFLFQRLKGHPVHLEGEQEIEDF